MYQTVAAKANADLIMSQFEKVCAEINSNTSENVDESSNDPFSHD